MADAHANFAYGVVVSAPSPATSGTSLTIDTTEAANFPVAPFNAKVWPNNQRPLASNSEIVRVTAINGGTFTITRAQEGSAARAIVPGDQIAAVATVKTFTDIESVLPAAPKFTLPAPLVATPANPSTTETIRQVVDLPANALAVGTTIRFTAFGIISGTTPTLTARVRLGAAGTTADAVVAATPAVAVATTTGWMVEMVVTIRSIGAAGTILGSGYVLGTAPGKSVQVATVAADTTQARKLSFSLQSAGTAVNTTITHAYTELVRA